VAHGQSERAADLAAHAVVTAGYLRVPAPAQAMASYNLACAAARAGQLERAADAAARAAQLNPELRAKLGTEPDLAGLRAHRSLSVALV
jgi:hypothetical protein